MSGLIARLKSGERSNALDMLVEIELFNLDDSDEYYTAVRPNSAGTKLIYTRRDGSEETCWAFDHTLTAESRADAISALTTPTATPADAVEGRSDDYDGPDQGMHDTEIEDHDD